jgi:hypothetical protein
MAELKLMFYKKVQIEHYDVTKTIENCILKEGGCMHHEAILVDLLRRLEFWGFPTPLEYNTDIILASLLPSYDDFIACYECWSQ